MLQKIGYKQRQLSIQSICDISADIEENYLLTEDGHITPILFPLRSL